jgi:hypothetical protein
MVGAAVNSAAALTSDSPAARSGHGLHMVAQIAARWAVEPLPDGKVVWAELPAAPLA